MVMDENEVIHNTDGYGALDLGATEIVGSLEALEALMEIRSSVHGIQEPVEVFTTIDAEKVPILIGVKTLEKMGALIDVCGRWLVLSAISPEELNMLTPEGYEKIQAKIAKPRKLATRAVTLMEAQLKRGVAATQVLGKEHFCFFAIFNDGEFEQQPWLSTQ
eukprot:g477.t1